MDDLDAVLASLEHTETALRTKPSVDVQLVDDPLTQTTTDLDKYLSTKLEAPLTQITTDLDKDFAAELEAISAPPIKKMSFNLDAVHDTFSVQTLDARTSNQKGKNGKKNTTNAKKRNNRKDTEEDEAGMDDISEIKEESVEHKDEKLEKLVGTLEYHISQMKFETISAETTISQYSTTKFDSTMTKIDAIERRVHRNITDLHIHNEGAKFYLLQVHTYLDNLKITESFNQEDKNQAWKRYRNHQSQTTDLSKKAYKLIVELEKISLKMQPFISNEYLTEHKQERDMRVIRSQSESTIVHGWYNGEHGYFKDEPHLIQSSTDKRKNSAEPSLSDQPQKKTDKKYKNMQVELNALNDKNNRVEELIKTVDIFIQSEKEKGAFQSNIRTREADKLCQDLMQSFVDISSQRSKTIKYMSDWKDYVSKNLPTDDADSNFLPSYKVFEKNYVDRELLIEGYIDERISELHQICTLKYIKTIPKFEAKHGLSFTITRDHQKYKQPEFKTINTHITTTTFATKLTLFTQNFLALVYPPIPTPPWSRISTYTTMPTQKHKNAVHNTALAALCKRVAHITAVADRHPLLAALRFALEITPKSPLLIHALKSTPTILASRAAAEPHTNIVSIRACLAEDKLNRLIRFADADLNRIRIEKQEMLNQLRQSKGNKIPRSIYTKQSRGKSHKHNHTHGYQSKNDERQNQEHDDNASQSSKKSNQTTSSKKWWNPLNFFDKADDMVKSYQDRDVRNTNV